MKAHPFSRDGSFFAFNDEFASLVIGRMDGEFGFGFPKEDYPVLRQSVVEDEEPDIPAAERERRFSDLAEYFDELTKYVIKYLADHSEVIKLTG